MDSCICVLSKGENYSALMIQFSRLSGSTISHFKCVANNQSGHLSMLYSFIILVHKTCKIIIIMKTMCDGNFIQTHCLCMFDQGVILYLLLYIIQTCYYVTLWLERSLLCQFYIVLLCFSCAFVVNFIMAMNEHHTLLFLEEIWVVFTLAQFIEGNKHSKFCSHIYFFISIRAIDINRMQHMQQHKLE